ncbi:beta-N-acetylhexosaminidase [Pedosphaera parvula]|uniref:beta-N-acetylhexosaminidase n=1 Tax=Pedosphaera parvula (strain Ellin514) TaxID=320771 RepID=B9XI27_PEDPL|nr:beta-N-acetylhexosaminidase [Pedosphaera parvula]EEF60520.1 Beta-N-acetylhexosaminidase [Pedosphaera parvula Ellin514]
MKRLLSIFAILFCAATAFATSPALIPLPQQMVLQTGTFTLCPAQLIPGAPAPAVTKILVDTASRETGEYLAAQLFKSTGYRFEIATNSGAAPVAGTILLTTNSALAILGVEGYELTVATNSVVIRAPASAGVFYGVQSLLQLLPPEIFSPRPVVGVPWTIPCVYIQDAPRFPWRGWMLDSVRHFFNKDEVKEFVDAMALHKLNMFHWHLDDDTAWRIEILKWPLLTQVGAWRTNVNFGLNPRSSTAYGDDGRYGGFYTQADIREIVAYAAQRHITVVPEIEMPGHSSAALNAYPQFGCGCQTCSSPPGSLDNTNSNAGGVFCAARPETMAFLQDVLTEVMDLFPGPYIHVGGDEVNSSNWQQHSLDQTLKSSLGITSMQQYQGYFTQQIANWLKSRGRTMIGWSEIMNGGLVTNAVVMDWLTGSSSRAQQAATNQQFAVMTPTSTCYINYVENPGVTWSVEPPSQSGTVTLSTVYNFEPIPANLPAAFTNYILGAQGNNWAEFIPSRLNMEFKMFPRLCALAEVTWTAPSLKNYTDFSNRLAIHKQRLTQMGVNYNPSLTPPQIAAWTASQISTSLSVLSWDITSSVTTAGEIDVSFCWKTGANGLDIAWAALLENGVEIDRDTHAGFTGATPSRPAYVLRLPARKPGATYILQAFAAGRSGTNSNGVIYRPNWD